MTPKDRPRVAIVHDALINAGGAERVLAFMHETFPDAPIYTAAYHPESTYPSFRGARVVTLPGSRFATSEALVKRLFPLWVAGFANLTWRDFDVVLSSTTWGAKFVRPPPSVHHVCYCYAPNRLLWSPEAYNAGTAPAGPLGVVVAALRGPLRRMDARATIRADRVATTCLNMAGAIRECYGVEPRVIYPPVRLQDYEVGTGVGEYYLSVSRLVAHKRVDVAIEACRRLGRSLVVVGEGPEAAALRVLADDRIRFVGRVSESELRRLYANARALIFPSLEDYGLAPLEAQASGRPVVALGAGGVLETVVEGVSGVFFASQDADALEEAIVALERMSFDPVSIRAGVARFSVDAFRRGLTDFVASP